MDTQTTDSGSEKREKILEKRIRALSDIFDLLCETFPEEFENCTLDSELLRETVENYLNDRDAYKMRRRITEDRRIKHFKIAGMVAASVAKYRPIQLGKSRRPRTTLFQNEMLALWHGILACAEPYSRQQDLIDATVECPHFQDLANELQMLLHRKPDSAEAFIVIFQAICINYFPLTLELPSGD